MLFDDIARVDEAVGIGERRFAAQVAERGATDCAAE